MGGASTGVCHYGARDGSPERYKDLSASVREALDAEVRKLLEEQVLRARAILGERKALMGALRSKLLAQGRLESGDLADLLESHAPDLKNRIKALRADRDDEEAE
jgi:ATP-dependent Zn protease